MRLKVVVCLIVALLFTGCKNTSAPLENAISLRNKILASNGCSFSATVTADYGDAVYHFSMDCTADKEGNLTFRVTEPETIAGIQGKLTATGGALTFDDQVLAFPTLADGEISPVTAPWVFMKTLRSGYIRSCTEGNSSYQIEIDDSYEEDALRLLISINDYVPTNGEIFWNGRRVITINVEHFAFL